MRASKSSNNEIIAYGSDGFNRRFIDVERAAAFFGVGKPSIYKCVRLGVPIKRNSCCYYLDYLYDFLDLTEERKRGEI